MICGKTKTGFTFAVSENAMNDMELVDLLADDDINDAIKASKVVKKLLSDEQRKQLYDHVRTPEGRVPMDAISQEVADIFVAFGKQGKKLLTLAGMLAADRDALICDLAETYGLFDLRALPVSLLATLASGLRENSRIKMKLLGQKVPQHELLLAAAVDRLSILCWHQTEDGRNGTNFPPLVLDAILDADAPKGNVEAFETAWDFESAWAMTTGVAHG